MTTSTCFLCGKNHTNEYCHECIQTADQARMYAIDWQNWTNDQNLSYGELADYQAIFTAIATTYPELKDEFIENAII